MKFIPTPNSVIQFQKKLLKEKLFVQISLNSPSNRNALSKKIIDDLQFIINEIKNDKSIHAAIIDSATPNTFCAGADLKERINMTISESFVDQLRNTFNQIYQLEFPTIASIQGPALGGGLELALCCDFRIATEKALIGLPETALAIIPGAGGTQMLQRVIGVSKAKELIYMAKRLSAQEALQIGILNYVEKDNDALQQKSEEMVSALMKNGPFAIRMAKKAIQQGQQLDLNEALKIEKSCVAQILQTEDRIEGLKSFIEKRSPLYQNK